MAGGGFLHRVLQYVANEFIVDRLANSHTFQRFAVRSAKAIENASQTIPKKTEQMKEQLTDFVEFLKSEWDRRGNFVKMVQTRESLTDFVEFLKSEHMSGSGRSGR